jgi:hypothetical protein
MFVIDRRKTGCGGLLSLNYVKHWGANFGTENAHKARPDKPQAPRIDRGARVVFVLCMAADA